MEYGAIHISADAKFANFLTPFLLVGQTRFVTYFRCHFFNVTLHKIPYFCCKSFIDRVLFEGLNQSITAVKTYTTCFLPS